MKRTHAKKSFQMLLAGFFLLGLMFFGASDATAQATNINHNWKQTDQALGLLGQEVKNLHSQLPGLSGIPLNNAKSKVYYYKELIQTIGSGTPIGAAVFNGVHIFDDPGTMLTGKPTDVVVDNALKNTLINDAVTLLTQ